jgi:hypothetical protein
MLGNNDNIGTRTNRNLKDSRLLKSGSREK